MGAASTTDARAGSAGTAGTASAQTGTADFHRLIVIQRWGWIRRLNADDATTATSPDGRIVRDHDPPGRAA